MKIKTVLKIVLIGFLIISIAIVGYISLTIWVLNSIPQSHLEANVVEEQYFDEYLKRDIKEFFKNRNPIEITSVQYQLLEKGPRQTGIAFPKYYARIQVFHDNNLLESGVAIITAVNKEEFRISPMDYMNYDQIRLNPDILKTLFPESVIKTIESDL